MPSSKKTPNLLLNKWLGGDKPKKDDFNEDNEILDQNFGTLRQSVSRLEQQSGERLEEALEEMAGRLSAAEGRWGQQLDRQLGEARTALEGSIASVGDTLTGQVQTVQSTVSGHTGNGAIHVTQAQKNAWDIKGAIIGSYTGNSGVTRTIDLGYAPRCGMVFAVGYPPLMANWGSQYSEIYSGFFTSGGGSAGVSPAAAGFTVTNSAGGTDGYAYRMNQSGMSYLYIIWR